MTKLLFLTRLPFYPESSGGSECFLIYLFQQLCQMGWQIEVFCGSSLKSSHFWKSIKSTRNLKFPTVDTLLGYPCWRQPIQVTTEQQWISHLDQLLQRFKPDVVVSHDGYMDKLLSHTAQKCYPSFYLAQWLSPIESDFSAPSTLHVLANSPYLAEKIGTTINKKVPVILPFTDLKKYQVEKDDHQFITFINPIPAKGVEIALKVAQALPQERFLFVKGKWSIGGSESSKYFLKLASKLSNIDVWEHQEDMRKVYAVTNILLMPSQFFETFGRVILEAQINKIPVIASKVGGIPYTLGDGGILIDTIEDFHKYAEAIKQIRSSHTLYNKLSDAALQNTQRPEFDAKHQIQSFTDFIESHLK